MKLADNITYNTFQVWAARKAAGPQTDKHTRASNGRKPNAQEITSEELQLITLTTARA